METEILSLKSIYRLIRDRDYPVPSDGVFGPKDAKGLTLLSFWKQVLCDRWLQTQHGQIIWRSEGSINRYHSELCNRKSCFAFYAEYTREILDGLTDAELFLQSELFARFLRERSYRRSAFCRKMSAYLNSLREEDRPVLRSLRLSSLLKEPAVSDVPEAFSDGWLLTVLTLYAMSDGGISWASFSSRGLSMTPSALYQAQRTDSPASTEVLTDQSGELWHSSLTPESFFGRERALFDLTESAKAGKKVLLCGLGGVGKTELLRQFLLRSMREEAFRRIAAIQYNGNLIRSFTRGFLHLKGVHPDECFHEGLYLLSREPGSLLIIDNVTSPDDPSLKELIDLPCPVLITARFSELPGFVSYPLKNPDRQAAELIFRSNYRQALRPEDFPSFDKLMAREIFHHPLTITMLARASRANRWRMDDLEEKIQSGYSEIRFQEGEQKVELSRILRRLYESTRIDPEKQKLLRLLSILPYRAYAPEKLARMGGWGDVLKVNSDLGWLSSRGWLEVAEESEQARCMMHPLIADCVRAIPPREDEFMTLWKYADSALAYDFRNLPPEEGIPEKKRLAESVLQAAMLLRQPVSRKLAETCVQAALWLDEDQTAAEQLKTIVSALPGEKTDLLLMTDIHIMTFGRSIEPDMMARMEKELTHPLLPQAWHLYYLVQSLTSLVNVFDHQRVTSLLKQELARTDLTPFEKQELLLLETVSQSNSQANVAAYDTVCQGMTIAEQLEAGREKKLLTLIWSEFLATMLLRLGRKNELREIQKKIRILRESTPESLTSRCQNDALYAQIAESEGRLGDAISIWLDIREWFNRLEGKGGGLYIQACSQLGLLNAKIGNHREAAEYYQEGIQLCHMHPESKPLLHILLNNYAVLLLDMKKPEKALPLLREAVMMALPLGGVPLAEPRKNLARCLRMKGEISQARILYMDVLPVFAENYGEKHPKTMEVRQCIQELTEERSTD